MLDQRIVYSEERKTWNLFVNGEWYYEGDYETCENMMFNNACDDNEDEEYEEYFDDTGNMPCDTYGPLACTESCSNYPRCMGWES